MKLFFSEDKKLWKKYNESCIEILKSSNKHLYQENGESDFDYYKKSCKFFEKKHSATIMAEKIHLLDRDKALLEAITNDLNVSINGLGHTEYWITNRNKIKEDFSIDFESYATDIPVIKGNRYLSQKFTKNPEIDPKTVFDIEHIKRKIRLIEEGRIVNDRKPDYIGTWRVVLPSEGYFEVFVENEKNGNIKGIIEDCLGTAKFEGKLKSNEFNFVKKYDGFCHTSITPEPIQYESKRVDNEFHGYFYFGGFGTAFYMIKTDNLFEGNKPKIKPYFLSERWYILKHPNQTYTE